MGDTSGSRGSIVASLILNADPYEATLIDAEDATRRASGSIGASLDRINKKQLNVAATSLLKNFVSPAALAVAGASMATDLIAGFSTGKFKNWEEAGRGLMESLKNGIESIPIVGTFAKLGEAIGNAVFGIDQANESLAQTNKEVALTDTLVKSLAANNKYKIDSEEAVQKRIEDIGKSAKLKELEAYKASLEAQNKLNLENEVALFNSKQQVVQRKIMVQGASGGTGEGGGGYQVQIEKDNPNYLAEINKQEALRNSFITKRKEEQESALFDSVKSMRENLDIEERANIAQTAKIQGQKDEAAARAKALSDAIALAEVQKRQAADQAAADAKFSQHMTDRIVADEASLQAAKETQALKFQASATGLSSAIGNIKVAGSMDFSKSIEVEKAQKQLDATVATRESVRAIEETLRKVLATP